MDRVMNYINGYVDENVEDKYFDELTPEELMEIIEAQDREFNEMYDELYSQILDMKCNRAIIITFGTLALVYFTVTIVMGFIDMLF